MIIYYLYKNRVGNWLPKYIILVAEVAELFKLVSLQNFRVRLKTCI